MSTITQAKPSSLEQEFTDDISAEGVYILAPEEEGRVKAAIQSLDAGNGIPNEVVKTEIREWLDNHPIHSR